MGKTRTRTRQWVSGPSGHIGTKWGVSGLPTNVNAPGYVNYAICNDSVHPGPPYLSGGDLLIRKRTVYCPVSSHISSHPAGTLTAYEGRLWAEPPTYSFPGPTDLTAWGTRGWYRALPIHDVSGVARFLGELKDIPQTLRGIQLFLQGAFNSRKTTPSYWSDAFLNGQFGIAPVITDLFGILTLGNRLDNAMQRILRLNGKPIHRRFSMDVKDESRFLSETFLLSGGLLPVLSSFCYGGSGQERVYFDRVRYKRHIFFEGEFGFYFTPEELANPRFLLSLRAKLAGVLPDILTLYQLTPWSWLIDWFTSMGTIVKNISLTNKYRQYAKYAYVMCTESYTTERYASTIVKTGSFPSSQLTRVSCTAREERVYKSRVAASPYGFGLTWDGFSPFQLSILAALGLSRA